MSGQKTFISDRPSQFDQGSPAEIQWNSDAIVEQLSRLGLRYIALVPGSSYRGVHDSLVNYKGNTEPEILLCLHEEHCIALAHGYAKVTERPMAAAVHANVGLMHAVMAIYNAFCDRVPMLILGATGPVDAAKRRPWIDWVHTAGDQGALIRPFIKWDDQPQSVAAAISSLTQATSVTSQKPSAPVYICLDVELQETRMDPASIHLPTTQRYLQTPLLGASVEDVETVKLFLRKSKRPLFLFGRVNRTQESWDHRVALAEQCDARVLTDLKQAAAFPTHHERHAAPPAVFNSPGLCELVRTADVIISFDWVDLAGTLQASHSPDVEPSSTIVHISLDSALHNGWSKDHFGHPPVDYAIAADPDKFVAALLKGLGDTPPQTSIWETPPVDATETRQEPGDHILMSHLADALYSVASTDELCLIRLPLGWKGGDLRATHPLSYLGQDGGGGLASGPGQAVGSALALKDTKYLPVAVVGDGDFLMGSSALWTAARYKIPLLVIIANNASFYNDEVHQERVARERSRSVENKWIGIRIDDPLPNLSQNAASFGATVVSDQVTSRATLSDVLRKAVQEVKVKKTVVVVDIAVPPNGYSSALNKAK